MSETAAIQSVIAGMYAMISGPAGGRDWSLQRAYFHPDARLIRTAVDASGKVVLTVMSLDQYRENVTPFFAQQGFYEIEIGQRIDVFGNVAHAWSAYEARTALDDAAPERRGINSIQLLRGDDGTWRIIAMIWDNERAGLAIPDALIGARA